MMFDSYFDSSGCNLIIYNYFTGYPIVMLFYFVNAKILIQYKVKKRNDLYKSLV